MPDLYLLHVRTTRCRSCGAIHTSSELFSVEIFDRAGRKLKPALHYEGGEIQKVALPLRTTPLCHACVDTAEVRDDEAARRWSATVTRKLEAERQARREAASAGRTSPTKPIEDLA